MEKTNHIYTETNILIIFFLMFITLRTEFFFKFLFSMYLENC